MNWKTGLHRVSITFLVLVWLASLVAATQEDDPARALGSTLVYLIVFTALYKLVGVVLAWIVRGFTDRGAL